MSIFPRGGLYEIFIHNRKVYCFDDRDLSVNFIPEQESIHKWIQQQDPELWYSMDPPHDRTAYYLSPKLYFLFKLKWLS